MILIYYKDKDGNIIDYMKPPDGWTMGQINREIESFNRLHDNSTMAYMEFYRDNSLGAYLARKAKAV